MKKLSIIAIVIGLIILLFTGTGTYHGMDFISIFSFIIGLIIIISEKRFWIRSAALILILITIFIILNDINTSYRFWPNNLDKKLYRTELWRTKPELIGKENKPLMKVIWYQKDTTNLLPEQKYDIFFKYTEKLYLLYSIFAFTFLLIAVNKNKTYERVIWMFAGSLFLALMLIVLQLRYMQWEQKLKLKYDTIKKELIKQSSEDNKGIVEKLPNINNNP